MSEKRLSIAQHRKIALVLRDTEQAVNGVQVELITTYGRGSRNGHALTQIGANLRFARERLGSACFAEHGQNPYRGVRDDEG